MLSATQTGGAVTQKQNDKKESPVNSVSFVVLRLVCASARRRVSSDVLLLNVCAEKPGGEHPTPLPIEPLLLSHCAGSYS